MEGAESETEEVANTSRNVYSAKRKKCGRMTDVMKKIRLSSHETGPDCKCKKLKCFQNVSAEQRLQRIKQFNEMATYDEQNMYLFGLMSINQIKQRRSRRDVNEAQFHDNAYSYKVRVLDGKKVTEIPVCAKAFVSIHGITTRRVQTLQTSGKQFGAAPKDKRGKYKHVHCKTPQDVETAVKDHISSFKGTPSHYSRGASKKMYLPPELNVNKMHQMYKEKNLPAVSYEYYRKIFNTQFNIKFGFPRSDTCSMCDKFQAETRVLEERLKSASNKEEENILLCEQKKLKIENDVHKAKAETFYTRKRGAKIKSRKDADYEGIVMDFQKNLSTPNISTNDVYYKRQLSVFTFNIHVLSNSESYFYCYDETIGGKGADEVVSMLHHFIFTQLNEDVKHVELFCDNCGGQNKNYILALCCALYKKTEQHSSNIPC